MARVSVRFKVISALAFVLISILAFAFIIQTPGTKLLTKNIEEVHKITVVNLRNGNRTSQIMQAENIDLINKIYQSINTTNTRTKTKPDASEELTTDPYFKIRVSYSDGTKDIIYSGESSNFVYRRLSGNGWVGGKNDTLIEVVKSL